MSSRRYPSSFVTDDPTAPEASGRSLDLPEAPAAAEGGADDADVRDELPADLDVSGYVGPYLFPNNNRRRVPGYLYLGCAVACVLTWALTRSQHPVLVNGGFLWAALGLAAVGVYHLLSGWDLDCDEREALVAATRQVGFAVGHASAQLGWRGLRSRPTWRILLYSAENPPAKRGLVLVDGVDAEIVSYFTEDNPEDWSDLGGDVSAGQGRQRR